MKEDQRSFAELRKIAANQATTIKNENQILANQKHELTLKKMQLEAEIDKFEEQKHAELKHLFLQSCDFAIRTLPWYRRSPEAIVSRATEILSSIRRETAKHVAAAIMANKIAEDARQKPIEEIKDDTVKVLDGIIGDEVVAAE